MGSEAVEVEKGTPEPHGSPPRDDPEGEEEEEQVTPKEEGKRGTKRVPPEKEDGEPEEEGTSKKRPSRERKSVERYSALSPRKQSASKALSIEQGSGTKLKDIPNVAFKLSKRKADENLQALHSILFGRKSNVHFLKRNISQFSGFVWSTNEEKQKTKVKEKLDKYTKDKLVDFCELLDIHFPRATTKKEEISAKLLEFLESPHATREVLLADKEKKRKKRMSRPKVDQAAGGDASSDKETKKRKKHPETKVKKGQKESTKAEVENEDANSDGSNDASSGEEDDNDLQEESDHTEQEEKENEAVEPQVGSKGSDDDAPSEDAAEPVVKGKTKPTKKPASVKSDKNSSKRASKKIASSVEDEGVTVDSKHCVTEEPISKTSKAATKEKVAQVKSEDKKKPSKKNVSLDASEAGPSKCSNSKKGDKMKSPSKKNAELEEAKAKRKKEDKPAPTKKQGKGKKNAVPTTEELRSVVSSILKEVDFNTATLADILKKLGTHFNMDLIDRKAEVKGIIEDVINNMTDDEDADNDEEEEEDNSGSKKVGR